MIRCLVVDDDPEIRAAVQQYLRGFEMDVETAVDGASMRRALLHSSFDVVVLDVMLPDESGLALCHWLRATSSVP
jgi:two-component system OmpR family response regulator